MQWGSTNISAVLCLPGFPKPLQLSTENPKGCISYFVLVFIYWGKVGAKLLRCLYAFKSNHRLLHVKWLQKGINGVRVHVVPKALAGINPFYDRQKNLLINSQVEILVVFVTFCTVFLIRSHLIIIISGFKRALPVPRSSEATHLPVLLFALHPSAGDGDGERCSAPLLTQADTAT